MRPPGLAAPGDNTHAQAMDPIANGVSPAHVHMSMGGTPTPNLLPDGYQHITPLSRSFSGQQVYKQQEQMAEMAPGQPPCFSTC